MTPRYPPEQIDAMLKRLQAFVREHAPGGCKMLSRGYPCGCLLCVIGELAAMLRQAAADARRVCETCRFAGHPQFGYRECFNDFDGLDSRNVPLTVDGEPFGCRGWQAKSA